MADNFTFALSKLKMFAFKMSVRTPRTLLKNTIFWFGLCFFHGFYQKFVWPIFTIVWLFLQLGGPFFQKLFSNFVFFLIMELPQEFINDLSKEGFDWISLRPLSIRSKRPELAICHPF